MVAWWWSLGNAVMGLLGGGWVFFSKCRGWVYLVIVVVSFPSGDLVFFLIIFYEEEERQRERGERRGKERKRWGN